MERCKHGMLPQFCGMCQPPPERRPRPKARAGSTVYGASTISPEDLESSRVAIIRTKSFAQAQVERALRPVTPSTTFVHFDGPPFKWAVAAVLQRATALQTIQVVPSCAHYLRKGHRQLAADSDVEIVVGYIQPWSGGPRENWGGGRYSTQQTFMDNLDGEQRRLFEELLALGFEAAQMATLYFRWNLPASSGHLSQVAIGREFGYPEEYCARVVNMKILGVLRYLDPTYPVMKSAMGKARGFQRSVRRARAAVKDGAARKVLLEDASVDRFPEGLPPAAIGLFLRVTRGLRAAGEALLQKDTDPRLLKLLAQRFGLARVGLPHVIQVTGPYRTLAEVGDKWKLSRERIRQLQVKALALLAVDEEDEDGADDGDGEEEMAKEANDDAQD